MEIGQLCGRPAQVGPVWRRQVASNSNLLLPLPFARRWTGGRFALLLVLAQLSSSGSAADCDQSRGHLLPWPGPKFAYSPLSAARLLGDLLILSVPLSLASGPVGAELRGETPPASGGNLLGPLGVGGQSELQDHDD